MITIIHGQDLVSSRLALQEIKDSSGNFLIFEAETLDLAYLKQIFEGELFSEKKTIIIENPSNLDKSLLSYLSKEKLPYDISLWEGDDLRADFLKKFPQARVSHFKLKSVIFSFLDSIKPGNTKDAIRLFHQTLKTTGPEVVFFMIVRHFRMMLAILSEAKIDELKRLQNWQTGKLKRQASLFGENKLIELYNKLFEIEKAQKTGKTSLTLLAALDLFLLNI